MYSLITPKTRTPRKQARPVKRSRVQSASSMVPRSLRYSGECKFTRTCPFALQITALQGFSVLASNYREILLTYSPTAVTVWGSNVNYVPTGVTNASEISALWERVKIEKVELTIMSDVTDHVGIGTGPAHSAPQLLIANDVNGPTTGSTTTIDKVLQDSNCKSYQLSGNKSSVKWTVRPKYQRLIQYTSINSSFEPATGFVQSDTDIPHYGTRIGINNIGSVASSRISIVAKIFYHCKNIY